jgi:Carboxypeptidase regulatory-like domain/TonB dependent receptor-like, beta-barrel
MRGGLWNQLLYLVVCTTLVLIMGVAPPLSAQVTGGSMSGTVTDGSGSAIPNAKIVIRNTATGITRETVTDSAGFFSAPNLNAGPYSITTSAPGFATQNRTGIVLTVGADQVVNTTMQVGEINQQVEVTTEAPTVQLSSSSLSGQIEATTVRELPLNGRDWTQLATLQPGVTSLGSLQPATSGSASSGRGNRGFGTQMSISGGRPAQNNYRVDGISVNDYGNSAPGNVLGAAVGVDAIQEFSVVTSNYSAEYGRTSGGVINAITRSGTNTLHGSAYDFLRNSALDSKNFFDSPTNPIPSFRRNQFGGSAGGPIIRDKTFIFGDYEGLRQSLGLTRFLNVPSAAAHNGNIHYTAGTTPPTGCTATSATECTLTVDPKIAPLLALYPLPPASGTPLGAGDTVRFSYASQQVATENYFTTRFDHHFSNKDNVFVTYQFDNSLSTLPDSYNVVLIQQHASNQHVAIEETHIFTTSLINNIRFGYNRVNDQGGGGVRAINSGVTNPALSAIPGRDVPAISGFAGVTAFQGGVNDQPLTVFHWNSFQVYDDANFTRGKHSLKFGFDVERDQNNVFQHFQFGGTFSFGTISNFLLNRPTQFTGTLPQFATPRYYRQTIFGAYIQDDYRVKPNLTLNLGLRYEMSTNTAEKDGKMADLLTIDAPTVTTGTTIPISNPTLKNFEPRIGFAWDPFRTGKTSVRGGAGLFDVLPLQYQIMLTQLNLGPFAVTGRVPLTGIASPFPDYPITVLTGAAKLREAFIDPNPKRNYVLQWNLSVQRELATGLTATVAYLGSRGVHNLFRADDANSVVPTFTPAGFLWPASGGALINPNFGRIDYTAWNGNSTYHGLQLQVNKNLSHGLLVGGSYTFSKSVDQGSAGGLGDPFSNSIAGMFPFEPDFNRGLSDYNVKHNMVLHTTWSVPSPKIDMRVAKWALGGWELGSIVNVRSGLPFTAFIAGLNGDPLGVANGSPYDYPDRIKSGACSSAVFPGQVAYINTSCFSLPLQTPAIAGLCAPFASVPTVGGVNTCRNLQGNGARNDLIGPGSVNVDFSVFKNNYIGHSERVNAQFRLEMFNLFNRANFNAPTDNANVFNENGTPTGGAGLITSTSTTSRQIQLALKVIF